MECDLYGNVSQMDDVIVTLREEIIGNLTTNGNSSYAFSKYSKCLLNKVFSNN